MKIEIEIGNEALTFARRTLKKFFPERDWSDSDVCSVLARCGCGSMLVAASSGSKFIPPWCLDEQLFNTSFEEILSKSFTVKITDDEPGELSMKLIHDPETKH
jgi:hypothetical protein